MTANDYLSAAMSFLNSLGVINAIQAFIIVSVAAGAVFLFIGRR